ncbi:MAG: leucine-rich repeat protein, partial [Oscillospiraceae bacterium]
TMPADTKIDVKDGTLSIAAGAFHGCKGLKSVIIPNSVTDIGGYAFMDCTGLKSVTIPSSVKIIDDVAFGYYYNDGGYEKLPEFTITGIKGSAAEIYAIERQINFRLPLSLGDVNGDGKVTAADAILALRAEAKLITLSQEELWAADVTGDSEVTAADAIKILRFEAKLITAF